MARILLTGANGFLGQGLSRQLTDAGHVVIGSDFPGDPARGVAAADLRDRTAVRDWVCRAQADLAVHAGAVSGQMVIGDDPARAFDVNLGGTVNLLEALRAAGVAHLVHLSSNAVYRPRPDRDPVTEDAPVFPAEPYGASKLAAEVAIASWAAVGDLSAVVLRISSIYGPGRRTPYLMSRLIAAAAADTPAAVTGAGANMRQFLHVSDALSAILAAIHLQPEGVETLNIAGAEWVPEAQIGALMQAHLPGLRLRIVPHEGPEADNAIGPLDCSRAAVRLGWRPATPLAEGIGTIFAADAAAHGGTR